MRATETKVSVLGAGAMGTALACLVAERGVVVNLWARREALSKVIERRRINLEYLPGRLLPKTLHSDHVMARCVEDADVVMIAVPSRFTRGVIRQASSLIGSDVVIISAAKGVEYPPLRWMSEVVREELPDCKVSVISGPNFASELVDHSPAAMVIASEDKVARRFGRSLLESKDLRIWESTDIVGVQVCSCIKGLTAIATGLADAFGMGDNTRGELLVQAVREAGEMCNSIGADPRTALGPAGLGDMIATSFSLKSRNRVIGEMLGLGLEPKLAGKIAREGMIVEGASSVAALAHLASESRLETPLIEFVFDVLCAHNKPRDAFSRLWPKIKSQTRRYAKNDGSSYLSTGGN
jgi:glycerol-3-phosphate dehydrogenase (NAD(P)+)